MNIRNYTQKDLDYICNNYNHKSVKQIANVLNKTENGIYNAVRKLGLSKQLHKEWTAQDIEFLKNNYVEMTSEEISKKIGHSISAINTQRDKLGLVRNKSWDKKEIQYLKENYNKKTNKEIAKTLKRSEGAITAKCFDIGLYKKDFPWNNEEDEFLKIHYREMTNAELSELMNRSENAIHLRASRMGMKKYPYHCNYHYFDTIDNEEKAYWLGFLTADGWISKNQKNNAGVIGCELKYSDMEHLKKFNKSLDGNYRITDRWRPCGIARDKNKMHHSCVIRIFSLTMYEALSKLGFSRDKSYDAHIPQMPAELMRHFIRGYFDGDGCFCFTNQSFGIKMLTASEILKEDIKKQFQMKEYPFSEYQYVSEFDTEMHVLEINQQETKLDFLEWIYKDASIYLDRKYKKYQKAMNKYRTPMGLAF